MISYYIDGRSIAFKEILIILKEKGKDIGTFIENAVQHSFHSWCKPGDTVIDCGAAKGWHTFDLAKLVGASGTVHAIEALPENCEFLRKRGRDWGFDQIVRIHEVALSDFTGETTFVRVPDSPGFSGIKQAWAPASARIETLTVPCRRLEDLIDDSQWAKVTFIKLDLEGGEFTALSGGARNLLSRARPLMTMECARAAAGRLYNYTDVQFFEFFNALNYDLVDIFGEKITPEIYNSPNHDVPVEFLAIPREQQDRGLTKSMHSFLAKELGNS